MRAFTGYIARDNEFYAKRTIAQIVERGEQIAVFPKSGRKVPEFNDPLIYEVFCKNYRIIYKAGEQVIKVLTVIHGARDIQNKTL